MTMEGMATTVTSNRPRAALSRVALPDARVRARRVVAEAPSSGKVRMVAACYIGLAMIVGLAFLLREVAPTPVAFALFLVLASTVVGALHPRRVRSTLRH